MQYSLLYEGPSRCKTPTLMSPGGASAPSRLHCEPAAVLLAALPLYTFFGEMLQQIKANVRFVCLLLNGTSPQFKPLVHQIQK